MTSLRILVIEDDPGGAPLVGEVLREQGEAAGFEIETAERLNEGLRRLGTGSFDALLLDLDLPSSQGFEALARVQAQVPGLPVVVVCGANDVVSALRAVQAGAQDYLLKGQLHADLVTRSLRYAIEAKRAERALRASERRYRRLVENAPDAIFRYRLTPTRAVEYVNPAACAVTGCAPEEHYADPDLALRLVHPEDRGPIEAALRGEVPDAPLHCRWIAKDGRTVWTEIRIACERDASGAPVAIEGIARDVTLQRQAEEGLREGARDLIESQRVARLGSYRTDLVTGTWKSSVVLDELLGITDPAFRRDVPGWLSIVHPAEREEMAAYFQQVVRKGHAFDREYRITRPTDREERWVHGRGELFADRQGRYVEMVGTIQDITERKQAEAARADIEAMLRQSQRLEGIGRLAGGIAHDFNNVLGVVTGFGELAQRQLPSDHPVQGRLEQILKAARRAADLTRQMLAFSRRQVMHPRSLDLNGMVESAQKMLGRVIGEDIELVLRLGAGLGSVMADPTQIDQVLMNLAVNARDAMPGGGRLSFETANVDLDEDYVLHHAVGSPGEYVMLAISDTGVGMDAETRSHIFEPFFTTKAEGQGTGLGLATVYGIVKQSGGFIWVYSEPNHGATFKIYLPRVDDPGERRVAERGAAELPRGTETILVVEDQAALLGMIQEVLEQQGYTVLAAGDGGAALDLTRQHEGPIHLLLTDVIMPGMSGRELAEHLATERPDAAALYMSGYSSKEIAGRGLLGADLSLVEKPFTATSLVQAVRKALDQS